MKRVSKLFCVMVFSLLFLVCGSSMLFVSADKINTPSQNYKLIVGNYVYGLYAPDASGETSLWWGAPNNIEGYVNDNNIVSPSKDYATAIAFTAPTDGTISSSFGLGTVYRLGEETPTSDGARFSVFLNDSKIFPADKLWEDVPQGVDNDHDGNIDTKLDISFDDLTLSKGDKLYYIVDCGANCNSEWDMCYLLMGFRWISDEYPGGVWYDSHASYWTTAESGEESTLNLTKYAKSQLASYHYLTVKDLSEEQYTDAENRTVKVVSGDFEFTTINDTPLWSGAPISEGRGYCYVNGDLLVPGDDYAAAVCFTAPCDGRISNGLGCGSIFRSGEVTELSDGARFCVLLNDTVIYPYNGVWADVPQGYENRMNIVFNSVEVKAGDKIYYIVESGGNDNSQWDIITLKAGFLWMDINNPNGVYIDFSENYWTDETFGSENVLFANASRKDVFSYQYIVLDECNAVGDAQEIELRDVETNYETEKITFSQAHNRYYKLDDPNLFVFPDFCDPGDYFMLGIVWTAPNDGRVDISNTYITNFYYQSEPNLDGIRSDGVRFKILLDGKKQIYPTQSEWVVLNSSDRYTLNMQPFSVQKNAKIYFVLDNNGECNYDLCKFDISIAFAENGESYSNKYNSITDFGTEREGSSAWNFLAITAVKDGGEEESGDIAEIIELSFSNKGGCSGGIEACGNWSFIILVVGVTIIFFKRLVIIKRKK